MGERAWGSKADSIMGEQGDLQGHAALFHFFHDMEQVEATAFHSPVQIAGVAGVPTFLGASQGGVGFRQLEAGADAFPQVAMFHAGGGDRLRIDHGVGICRGGEGIGKLQVAPLGGLLRPAAECGEAQRGEEQQGDHLHVLGRQLQQFLEIIRNLPTNQGKDHPCGRGGLASEAVFPGAQGGECLHRAS